LDLVIKCGGIAADDDAPVSAYGFTVRHNHRVVYSESAVIHGAPPAPQAAGEALRRALAWLLALPVAPGRATVRTCGAPLTPEFGYALTLLWFRGWAVDLQSVGPEYVSEAIALSRRTAVAADRAQEPAPPARRPPKPGCPDIFMICDGGYKPGTATSGLAVYAFLAWQGDKLVHRESGFVCRGPAAGSQMAELGAIVAALRWVANLPTAAGGSVQLLSDCQTVVHFLTGRGRLRRRRGSVMLRRTAAQLMSRLHRRGCRLALTFNHRKRVAQADALCRKLYANPPRAPRPVKHFLAGSAQGSSAGAMGASRSTRPVCRS